MSTYVVGDLQGCYSEFVSLLEAIEFNENKDLMYFVGDIVNRGPGSLKSLELVKKMVEKGCAQTVLGNHDLHLIATYHHVKRVKPKDTIREIVEADHAESLISWLKAQPLIIYDKSFDTTICHAGIYPMWDREQATELAEEVHRVYNQKAPIEYLEAMYGDRPRKWKEKHKGNKRHRFITNCFTRMRFCDEKARLILGDEFKNKEAPKDGMPWYQIPDRPMAKQNIAFGHWAALEGVTGDPYAVSIDTGCVWGGSLTALCLDSGLRFHISAGR